MGYDLQTQGLDFANSYLTGTIDSFFYWLPRALPGESFGLWLLMWIVSGLVFGLIFRFIFGNDN